MVLFPLPFYFFFENSKLLCTYKIISSNELARPVMGTIFLVTLSGGSRGGGGGGGDLGVPWNPSFGQVANFIKHTLKNSYTNQLSNLHTLLIYLTSYLAASPSPYCRFFFF